jgi:nucleotide-binding universal stress UspA family protein
VLQRILVPLDGSELAEGVIPYVDAICQRCEPAEVILFQAIPPPKGRSGTVYRPVESGFSVSWSPDTEADAGRALHPIFRDQEIASVKADVERELSRAIDFFCNCGYTTHVAVAFGRAAEQIVDYAEREKVDLIAMSTHGRSGLSRWVFGSVTEKVLRATHIPILLVRPPGLTGEPFPPQSEIEI